MYWCADLRRGRVAAWATRYDTLGVNASSSFLWRDRGGRALVTDGNITSAAGVTAGIDGALRVVADLCGVEVAEAIQLSIAYAPEPPFNSGTPESAPPAVLAHVRSSYATVTKQREQTARRVAERLGIGVAQ
jgi:cyclohexyl-isocyanide hydratase